MHAGVIGRDTQYRMFEWWDMREIQRRADPRPHEKMPYIPFTGMRQGCGLFGGGVLSLLLKDVQRLFVRTYWAVERVREAKPAGTQPLVFANNKLHFFFLLRFLLN